MLRCLAWRPSADNLWHIWCQSAITFPIKVLQIMNIFFRWLEVLAMNWGVICRLYLFQFRQDVGAQIRAHLRAWIYIAGRVSMTNAAGKRRTHVRPQRNQGNQVKWGERGLEERKKNRMRMFSAVNHWNEILYFPFFPEKSRGMCHAIKSEFTVFLIQLFCTVYYALQSALREKNYILFMCCEEE